MDNSQNLDNAAGKWNSISFVIPCYHSEKTLPSVVAEIDAAAQSLPFERYEIVMVNDGSGQETRDAIWGLCAEETTGKPCRRKGYELARNFGQHAALMAGIRHAEGDIIVCLDDDGQTPAAEVGKLVEAIFAGADVAYARYEHKEHSPFRNFGSWVNEKMLEKMLNKPRDLYVSSYFAMRRFVADEVLHYQNSYPYLLGLVLRSTKNIVNVPVNHRRREVGSSGYTIGKLLALWMNGFTAFSVKPLRIGTAMGAACAALALVYAVYTVIKKLVNPAVPIGFSALMTAVVFFGGMTLLMLGLAGEYIGRTYISVSAAPQYVIREETRSREKNADLHAGKHCADTKEDSKKS